MAGKNGGKKWREKRHLILCKLPPPRSAATLYRDTRHKPCATHRGSLDRVSSVAGKVVRRTRMIQDRRLQKKEKTQREHCCSTHFFARDTVGDRAQMRIYVGGVDDAAGTALRPRREKNEGRKGVIKKRPLGGEGDGMNEKSELVSSNQGGTIFKAAYVYTEHLSIYHNAFALMQEEEAAEKNGERSLVPTAARLSGL